tara:strand:+ start:243 stop:1028 length:786 start_codon:yes stop_codon:yes gene_type:complete
MNSDVPTPGQDSSRDGIADQESVSSLENSDGNTQISDSANALEDQQTILDANDDLQNESKTESSSDTSSTNQIPDTEARLQQLEKEHETLKSQYMRIAADFDNFRKRQTRDQDDLKIQLTCTTLSEILPIVDNFERARQQLNPEGEEAQALHRSYQGLYKQLVDVLKQLGVAPMRVVDQPFDPTLHEAVMREPSEEKPEDIVTEELQRGYHLNGRVLRHALVKVSMGPGPASASTEEVTVDQSNSLNEENESSEGLIKDEN